jgi:hypothetical protein
MTIAEGISRASLSFLRWRNKMRMVAAATSRNIQITIGAPAPFMPPAYDFECITQIKKPFEDACPAELFSTLS